MLFNCHMMAETELSKDYDEKQIELLKKGCLHGSARFYARRYALRKEMKKNADKSGG